MKSFLDIIMLIVQFLSLLITFPGYTFILVVNFLDWMKNKRLEISDQLISGISLSTLIYGFLEINYDYIVITKEYFTISASVTLLINILYLSILFCILLFSTFLAIHFCLKIVNINHKLYIYFQRRFSKMFPWIFLPSVSASILVSAPIARRFTQTLFLNSTDALQNPGHSALELFLFFIPYIVLCFLCFLLFVSSTLNIILSLRRHIRQINENIGEFRSEILEAHVTVMKTIISLFAFNLFYFSLLTIVIVTHLKQFWSHAFPIIYAMSHILGVPMLIRGSNKLQKKLQSIWFMDAVSVLAEQLQRLSPEVTDLRLQVRQQGQRPQTPNVGVSAGWLVQHELKIALPDRFSGGKDKFFVFIEACKLYFKI
ncbi:taste receptor type 2 member 114-like [Phyllobates terribilis]|uniref:taste receptor type 2 member 114-like n=1 Tax=Phyllobates terribilis TaxID=111132 RepID=UPI003CCAEBD8